MNKVKMTIEQQAEFEQKARQLYDAVPENGLKIILGRAIIKSRESQEDNGPMNERERCRLQTQLERIWRTIPDQHIKGSLEKIMMYNAKFIPVLVED